MESRKSVDKLGLELKIMVISFWKTMKVEKLGLGKTYPEVRIVEP